MFKECNNTSKQVWRSGMNTVNSLPGFPAEMGQEHKIKIDSGELLTNEDMNAVLKRMAFSRNRDDFSVLFSHFAPRLKSMLLGSGTIAETAEEIAQEAMLSVWRKCEMYDSKKASASTWIFTIARNLRIDRYRKEKRPELDPNDPSLVPAQEIPADEQVDLRDREIIVKDALEDLPEDQRIVVKLSFEKGLSHQEISEELGLPLGTVKSRLRLSFEKLRVNLRSRI